MHHVAAAWLPPRWQPLAVFLVGIVLLVETWWHGREGKVGMRAGWTLRVDNPAWFWFAIACKVAVGLAAVWMGWHFM